VESSGKFIVESIFTDAETTDVDVKIYKEINIILGIFIDSIFMHMALRIHGYKTLYRR